MTISLNPNFDPQNTFWALSPHMSVSRKKAWRGFSTPTMGKKLKYV